MACWQRKNMQKSLKIVAIFLLVLGMAVCLYPCMARRWNEYRQNMVMENYQKQVQEHLSNKQKKQCMKEAQEYNRHVTEFSEENYSRVLSLDENGAMGYLWIPKINLRLPIYHGTQEEILQKGIGHWKKSGLPVGGRGVNCVLTGHRGLPTAKLFTQLDLLEEGDLFYLKVLDETLAYQVERIFPMVDREDEETIEKITAPQKGKDLVTLVTCTPYGVNTHRLMVQGKRIQEEKQEEAEEKQKEEEKRQIRSVIFFLLVGAGTVGGFIRVKKKGVWLMLGVLILWSGSFFVSRAAGSTKEENVIVVHAAVEDQGTEVFLYRLAVQQEDGNYSYCAGFENLEEAMAKDDKNVIKVAVQLAKKQKPIEKLSLKGGCKKATDLVSGVYLLVPEDTEEYAFSPLLAEVSKEQGKEVEVYLKYERRNKEKSPKTGEKNVILWLREKKDIG